MTKLLPPDILRAATIDLEVTDLDRSRTFYRDALGLLITYEDENAIYFRACEEYLHHSLVIRKGETAALRFLGYRVRAARDLDLAVAYFREMGARVERVCAGTTRGMGETVRVEDPLGFSIEFFHEAEHVERFTQRYDRHNIGAISRLDHFNILTPDIPRGRSHYQNMGFKVAEEIVDKHGTSYAAWLYRKSTVHDIALTGGDGPRLHHVAFHTNERSHLLDLLDRLGAMRLHEKIERGPGRHGVSNAFYVYLRDPDGHRVEIYTQDYYTGDPDNPVVVWDVTDNRRRDWWGNAVVPSWYTEGSMVLNLDGEVQPLSVRNEDSEMLVTVGADGFLSRPSPGAR
jgi:catechol 2,3-dioxygenase